MSKKQKIIAFLPALTALLLFFSVYASEAYIVGVEADPKVVKAYVFGSDIMISRRGVRFESAKHYVITNVVASLLVIIGTIISIWFLLFTQRRPVVMSYFTSVITLVAVFAVGWLV